VVKLLTTRGAVGHNHRGLHCRHDGRANERSTIFIKTSSVSA
jgi:hypothetical protein